MASDIRQHLNSTFVHLSNKFRNKEVIQVYVEDDIDKVFWFSFLHPFELAYNVEFHVSIILLPLHPGIKLEYLVNGC